MRPDKRYGAFLILSIFFLMVFLFISPMFSNRNAVRGGHHPGVSKDPTGAEAVKVRLPAFPIDINTAGVDDLKLLPGVGEKTAERIIEKRKEQGGYRTVDELAEVKWIGTARLARIRNLVTIGNTGRRPGEKTGMR